MGNSTRYASSAVRSFQPGVVLSAQSPGRRQIIQRSLFFVIGLLFLDQSVRLAGDSLGRNSLWNDDLYDQMVASNEDILMVGDCRVAALPERDLQQLLGKKVLNGGASAEGLGHLAVSLEVLLSHPTHRPLLIFLNDDILSFTEKQTAEEIGRLALWMPHISRENQGRLNALVPLEFSNRLLDWSGLWRYRGRGIEMIRVGFRAWRGMPTLNRNFGHQNLTFASLSMTGTRNHYEGHETRKWAPSVFAVSLLNKLLSDMTASGFSPILVLSPMSELRNTERVNQTVTATVEQLAKTHGLKFINYLGNSQIWSKKDEWWGNPGHMNDMGTQVFVRQLAEDLKRELP